MKKIKGLITVIIIATVLVSCEKEKAIPPNTNNVNQSNPNNSGNGTSVYYKKSDTNLLFLTVKATDLVYYEDATGGSGYSYISHTRGFPLPLGSKFGCSLMDYYGPPIPIGTMNVFASTDGGSSWKELPFHQHLSDGDSCSLSFTLTYNLMPPYQSSLVLNWSQLSHTGVFNPQAIFNNIPSFQFKVEYSIAYFD